MECITGDNTTSIDEAGKRNNTTSHDDYNENEIKIDCTNFDNDSSNPKILTASRKTTTRKMKSMQIHDGWKWGVCMVAMTMTMTTTIIIIIIIIIKKIVDKKKLRIQQMERKKM